MIYGMRAGKTHCRGKDWVEIVQKRPYDVQNRYPNFSFDEALAMPVEAVDLYKLAEVSDIPYVIISTIEKTESNSFQLTVELHDVRRIVMLMRYQRECPCAFEEVVFQMLPDVATQLAAVKDGLETQCPPMQ